MKIFVAATEFCRRNKSHIYIFLRLVAATKFCHTDKHFHTEKVSNTYEAICRCEVLLHLVARPVHTEWSVANLSHSVFTPTSFSGSFPTQPPEREMGRVWEEPGNEVENTLESVKDPTCLLALDAMLEMDCHYFKFNYCFEKLWCFRFLLRKLLIKVLLEFLVWKRRTEDT